jgi:hypothetical protein
MQQRPFWEASTCWITQEFLDKCLSQASAEADRCGPHAHIDYFREDLYLSELYIYTYSVYLKGNTLGLDRKVNMLALLITSSLCTVRIITNTSLCGVNTLCVCVFVCQK